MDELDAIVARLDGRHLDPVEDRIVVPLGRRREEPEIDEGASDAEVPPALADILDELKSYVRTYVVLSDAQAVVITLFATHSYAVVAAEATPYLHFTSPEKRSGKTRALETLELVVANPLRAVNMSEAVLFRVIGDPNGARPTLLFDEVDAIFGPRSDRDELRGLLNAGYRRGALALRSDTKGTIHRFDAFCPKALAGIGDLPDTVEDRCIKIRMDRRKPSDQVARFRRREADALAAPIRQALAAWATPEVLNRLRGARPAVPAELDDRAADGWEPLLAIADAAGEGWGEAARAAAVSLGGGSTDESVGSLLLEHVHDAFDRGEYIATKAMLKALADRDDGPWAAWWAEAVASGRTQGPAARLAKILRRYNTPEGKPIKSRKLRVGTETFQGYVASDFADAWSRYCRSDMDRERVGTVEHRRSEPIAGSEPDPDGNTEKGLLTRDVPTVPTLFPSGVEQDKRTASGACDECGCWPHQGGHFQTCSRRPA